MLGSLKQRQLVTVLTGGLGSHRKVMAGIQAGHIMESELIIGSRFNRTLVSGE